MMRALRLCTVMVVVIIAACRSAEVPPMPDAKPSLPPIVTEMGGRPFWFGRSDHSPFGPMPYGLAASTDGATVVLRGDVPPGMGLPDGSYQQFTLTAQEVGSVLDFETSLSGPIVKGRMVEQERSDDDARYCMSAADGDCQLMEVRFRREANGVRFETRRAGEPHHSVLLEAKAP